MRGRADRRVIVHHEPHPTDRASDAGAGRRRQARTRPQEPPRLRRDDRENPSPRRRGIRGERGCRRCGMVVLAGRSRPYRGDASSARGRLESAAKSHLEAVWPPNIVAETGRRPFHRHGVSRNFMFLNMTDAVDDLAQGMYARPADASGHGRHGARRAVEPNCHADRGSGPAPGRHDRSDRGDDPQSSHGRRATMSGSPEAVLSDPGQHLPECQATSRSLSHTSCGTNVAPS